MKLKLVFPCLLALFSCEQADKSLGKESSSRDSLQSIAQANSNPSNTSEKAKIEHFDFQSHEDSLRKLILERKENKILKNSFLQELYLRNVAQVSNDSVVLKLSFNLHGPDCGAPDCYATLVRVAFKIGKQVVFPKSLPFQEHEEGCMEKENALSGSFQLLEQNSDVVIYYSQKEKRTLVLFSSNKDFGTTAFYFCNVSKRIHAKDLKTIIQHYDESDPNSIYPFTSWILTTNEYENFLVN